MEVGDALRLVPESPTGLDEVEQQLGIGGADCVRQAFERVEEAVERSKNAVDRG